MEKIAEGFKGEKAIVTPYYVRKLQAANPITQSLYVTHIGYFPNAKHHYRARPKGSPEHILIYCVEGEGWIKIQDRLLELGKNQAAIIPAQTEHSYGALENGSWSIYWVHFSGKRIDIYQSIIGIELHIADTNMDNRLLLFEEMYQNLDLGYSPDNLEYSSVCLHHFLASFKYASQFNLTKTVREEDVIQRSIRYMKDMVEHEITLVQLASMAGYSVSRYSALFVNKTSYAPMKYFHNLRIQRACQLLQFSDLKVKEIAYRLHFYNQYHFSKIFTQTMEITPSEYRRRYKDSSG